MINAKEELLKILKEINGEIKCAAVIINKYRWDSIQTIINPIIIVGLNEGYSEQEYQEFLSNLDVKYDEGYGCQQVYGDVWLMTKNTWISRSEYDGSEWWKYNECPEIPEHLKVKIT